MKEIPEYPKLREDITFHRVVLRGRETFIVKDPVRRKYMQFERLGRRLCELLDGTRTAGELTEQLSREFPDYGIDADFVERYLKRLMKWKLVVRDRFEYNVLLMERTRRDRERRNSLLHMTFPAIDPDEMLNWLIERLRWVTDRPFVIFYLLFIGFSYAILLFNLQETWEGLTSFYVFEGWSVTEVLLLYVTILLIIVVHEFGHGLTCKYFGGEVHQMGFLLIYLINPALYCNVSDSYRFPRKIDRLMVIFGGPMVELFIGSAFIYVWWLTDPGLILHSFAFKIVIFSSITSWLFNMNPLLKYDGYYALSEALEIPNLRSRAFKYLGYLIKGELLGLPAEEPPGDRREKTVYMIFGILVFLYTVFIFTIIFTLLRGWLVGSMGAVGWLLVLLLMWVLLRKYVKKGGEVVKLAALDRSGFIRRHTALVVGIVLLILAVPSLVRLPTVQRHDAVLEAGALTVIQAPAPSRVRALHVRSGEDVSAGRLLAELESPELLLEINRLEHRLQRTRYDAEVAAASDRSEEAARLQIEAEEVRRRLRLLEERETRLRITADRACRVLTPSLRGMRERFAAEGDTLLVLGRVDTLRAHLEIPERLMGDVRVGTPVKFKPSSRPWATASGQVVEVELQGAPSGTEDGERDARYGVELLVDNLELGLVPGQSGQVRLYGRKRSLWGKLAYRALRTLRLDFFL